MISAERVRRIARPRSVFSPSDNFSRPTHHLLYFESTDSYTIAQSSSVNNINGETATLNIRGKKTSVTIITSGTLDICESEQNKRTRLSQQMFDDDQDECPSDGENGENVHPYLSSQQEGLISTFPSSQHEQTALQIHRSCSLSDDEGESSRPTKKSTVAVQKRKQKQATSKTAKRQRINDHDENIGPVDLLADSLAGGRNDSTEKNILNQIENHLVIFQHSVTRSLKKMEKKIDSHLTSNLAQGYKTLDQYRVEKGQNFPAELIYNGYDLLTTTAKDLLDFSRKTLKLLFSSEELRTHILPPKRDHLVRLPLNQERFNILLEAIRIKFKLDTDLLQQCYNDLLKTKLSNFLYEERRRELRKKQRDYGRTLTQNIVQLNEYDHQRIIDEEEDTTDPLVNNHTSE